MDRGAWLVSVYGVAQSRTQLKHCSSSSSSNGAGCHNLSFFNMASRWGKNGNSDRLFSWAPKSLQMVTAAMKLKDACSLEE